MGRKNEFLIVFYNLQRSPQPKKSIQEFSYLVREFCVLHREEIKTKSVPCVGSLLLFLPERIVKIWRLIILCVFLVHPTILNVVHINVFTGCPAQFYPKPVRAGENE